MNITLPMGCPQCGTLLNVRVADWNHGAKTYTETYVCPACEIPNTVGVPGHVVSVSRRPLTPEKNAS